MKLRRSEWAQLGDSTQKGMSLVEGRLWSKLLMLPRPTVSDARHYIWTCLQAALASELAQYAFPTAQKSPFSTFSVLSPLACFATNSNVSTHWKHAEGMSLRYDAIFTLWCDFYKPVQNLFSTFSVIWEIIKPYKVGKYLIGFHLQLLYIRYLMTTW